MVARRIIVLVSGDAVRALTMATAWQRTGRNVTVVLLAAAAGLVRQGHREAVLVRDACAAGVAVVAHDDALRRRGLDAASAGDVDAVDLDGVAELVTSGADRVVWL